MRVIAGAYRGRRLECPKGDIIRPTTDKVKEAMFGALHFDIAGAALLDAFAGSGALGIEALSRGAAHVDFAEKNAVCLRTLRANLDALGDRTRYHVYKGDVRSLMPQLGKYDIMLLDPPYDAGLYGDVLEKADACGILKPGARVVMECRRQFDFTLPVMYNFVKRRDYGDISLW
jgi:16S rRNA (guanine966-N2)-methyltransferase